MCALELLKCGQRRIDSKYKQRLLDQRILELVKKNYNDIELHGGGLWGLYDFWKLSENLEATRQLLETFWKGALKSYFGTLVTFCRPSVDLVGNPET